LYNKTPPKEPRTDFAHRPLDIAGLGRGAVGFTTRSDIGPARPSAAEIGQHAPPGYARGAEVEKKDEDVDESQFDEFSGYKERLFGGGPYDAEDEEADKVYDAIDRRMDSKRKSRREALLEKELKGYCTNQY